MIKFKDFDELKDVYDKRKHNIFYENGTIKYKVSHIGSTIFCLDERHSIIELCSCMIYLNRVPYDYDGENWKTYNGTDWVTCDAPDVFN